jgi:hypothetical protein
MNLYQLTIKKNNMTYIIIFAILAFTGCIATIYFLSKNSNIYLEASKCGDAMLLEHKYNFIKCDSSKGLTEEIVKKAIEILNEK